MSSHPPPPQPPAREADTAAAPNVTSGRPVARSERTRDSVFLSVALTALGLLAVGAIMTSIGYLIQPENSRYLWSDLLRALGFAAAVFGVTLYLHWRLAPYIARRQLDATNREIHELVQGVQGAITYQLDSARAAIERQVADHLNDIRERIADVQNFEIIRERPDVSRLNKVFFKYVSDWIDKISIARAKSRITLEEDYVALFPYFFKRTLEQYPIASFVATSLARDNYLWKYQFLVTAIRKFMSHGGKMQRIFLLDTPFDEAISREEASVIKTNIDLGVTVFVASETKGLDPKLQRYFLAEEQHSIIAWEAHIIAAGQISRVEVTTVPEEVQYFVSLFREVKEYSKQVDRIVETTNAHGEKAYRVAFSDASGAGVPGAGA